MSAESNTVVFLTDRLVFEPLLVLRHVSLANIFHLNVIFIVIILPQLVHAPSV